MEKGHSAWNKAGTWEEKNIQLEKLKVYLNEKLS